MTEHTREWRKAIADNNTELLETLKTLNLLKDVDLKRDANGMLYVDKEGREELLDKAEQREALTNLVRLQASIDVAQKEQKVLITSLAGGLKKVNR